jgi:hypothetical protein
VDVSSDGRYLGWSHVVLIGNLGSSTVGLLDLKTRAVVHTVQLRYQAYARGILDDGRVALNTYRNDRYGAVLLSVSTGAVTVIGDKATSVTAVNGHTIAVGNGAGICDVYLQDMRNQHRTPLSDCPQVDVTSRSGRRALGWLQGPAIVDAATGVVDHSIGLALNKLGLSAYEETWLDETHILLRALFQNRDPKLDPNTGWDVVLTCAVPVGAPVACTVSRQVGPFRWRAIAGGASTVDGPRASLVGVVVGTFQDRGQ